MYKNRKLPTHKYLHLKMPQNRKKRENDYDKFKRLTIPPKFLSLNTTLDYPIIKDKKTIKCTPFVQQFHNNNLEIAEESHCQSFITGSGGPDYTKSSCSSNSPYNNTKPKSIFKEINEKYEQLILNSQQENSTKSTLCTSIQSSVHSIGDDVILQEPSTNNNFSRNLSQKIQVRFKKDSLAECIKNIRKHIQEVDLAISGERKLMDKPVMDMNKSFEKMNNAPEEELMELFPKIMWKYNTPPKQKILTPQLAQSSIKTALIQSAKDRQKSTLYEVKTNKLNVIRHNAHKNVDIDLKYLSNEVNVSKFADHGMVNCASSSYYSQMNYNVLHEEDESDVSVFQPIIDQPKKKFKTMKRQRSDSLEKLKKSNIFEENLNRNEAASNSADFYLNNVTFAPLNYDDEDKENKPVKDSQTPTKRKMFNFKNNNEKLFDFSNLN